MSKVYVFDHPLIQHKTALLRSKDTTTKDFRQLVTEIATLMTYEATRDLPLKEVEIETPLEKCNLKMLEGEDIAIVPILRAGLGFVDGMLSLVPNAKVGFIGMYRDPESHKPVEYYCKLPEDIEKRWAFVVDPMLATGGSLAAAIESLMQAGRPKKIHICCIIAAPEGIEVVKEALPEDSTIWCASIDQGMNENKYIVPGFGDCGDLCYGEKLQSFRKVAEK